MIIDWLVPTAFAISVLVRIGYYSYDRPTDPSMPAISSQEGMGAKHDLGDD